VQKQIAVWNTDLKLWTKPNEVLFSEHLELFSATWPTSGMTQSGVAYELPMQVPPIKGTESLSLPNQVSEDLQTLPTPLTTDRKGSGPNDFYQLRNVSKLFPTPTTLDSRQGNNRASFERNTPALGAVVHMLPTPVASEGIKATAAQGSEEKALTGQVWLTNIAHDLATQNGLPTPQRQLLGTPRTSSANGSTPKQVAAGAPKARIEDQVLLTDWGKFEPAIRRWEKVMGREAPKPTRPDGKDGNHRLSSKFTEWMMGLPDGWITGHDLKRNDELKLAGNGVVPQQAELALRLLLELPERKENNNE